MSLVIAGVVKMMQSIIRETEPLLTSLSVGVHDGELDTVVCRNDDF